MSAPKTAFFYNPLSHTVATRGSVLERAAHENDVLTYKIDDFAKLAGFMDEVVTHGVETIFIEGGDGTIHGVLTEVLARLNRFKNQPSIALLPGGMTNLVAANIGVKRPNPEKITGILKDPHNRPSKSLPLLRIKPTGEELSHYGFLLSTGALPAATQYCLDEIHTKGIGGSAAVGTTLFKVLFGRKQKRQELMAPTPITLNLGEKTIERDHLTSVATTLPKLIIGINPFWGTEDAPVHLTFADDNVRNKFINIARMFKKSQSGKARAKLERDGFHSWNIDEATLIHDGPLVLDGEVLPLTKAPITLSASEPLTFLS